MKKILITGASGFIGTHLVKKLKDNSYQLHCLNREKYPFDKIIKLKSVLRNKDYVIHLAGKMKGDNLEVILANLHSTLGLLEAISTLKSKPVFVFMSSFSVYGVGNKILSETSPLFPRNMYGLSKLWSEQIIAHFAKSHKICCVILRPSSVYGPNVPAFAQSVIGTFIYQSKNSQKITIAGSGKQSRDFVYVGDLVEAIVKVVQHRWKKGCVETFNICSGEKISINKLVNILGIELRQDLQCVYDLTYKERGVWIGNNSKAKKILGWQPKIMFKEGIKLTIQSRV